MIDISREMIGYGLIAILLAIAVPLGVRIMNKRHRTRLRRRGIKTYGH